MAERGIFTLEEEEEEERLKAASTAKECSAK
jgi:hypothetical protein